GLAVRSCPNVLRLRPHFVRRKRNGTPCRFWLRPQHDQDGAFWRNGNQKRERIKMAAFRKENPMSESRERVRIEDSPKRVRTYLGGDLIADTKRLKLVWEIPYYPAYYFPREDVRMDFLTPNGRTQHSPSRGDAQHFTVKTGSRVAEDA